MFLRRNKTQYTAARPWQDSRRGRGLAWQQVKVAQTTFPSGERAFAQPTSGLRSRRKCQRSTAPNQSIYTKNLRSAKPCPHANKFCERVARRIALSRVSIYPLLLLLPFNPSSLLSYPFILLFHFSTYRILRSLEYLRLDMFIFRYRESFEFPFYPPLATFVSFPCYPVILSKNFRGVSFDVISRFSEFLFNLFLLLSVDRCLNETFFRADCSKINVVSCHE